MNCSWVRYRENDAVALWESRLGTSGGSDESRLFVETSRAAAEQVAVGHGDVVGCSRVRLKQRWRRRTPAGIDGETGSTAAMQVMRRGRDEWLGFAN
ncbi:hypothetical protein M0R45_026151 [Rubus argutus]|uniref:MHC class I antigen n=1 Tax=Rubus argutus TaxID=59490 RepID=A0AAW1WWQ5_RUBAR